GCQFLQSVGLDQHKFTSLSISFLEPPTIAEIESLDTASTATSETKSVQPFVNLTELAFRGERHGGIGEAVFPNRLLPIFGLCPNLTRLILPTTILFKQTSEQFLGLLSNNLQQFQFLCLSGAGAGLRKDLQFLQVCVLHPQLKELICDFETDDNGDDDVGEDEDEDEDEGEDEDDEDEMVNPLFSSALRSLRNSTSSTGASKSNITTLTLPTYKDYPASFLGPLLRDYLPNVERLVIPRIEDVDDMELQESFRESCPKLKSIDYDIYDEGDDGVAPKAFIMGSSGGVGLRSFRVGFFSDENNIMDLLIQHHSATLEEIDLNKCGLIKPKDINNIFAACSKLSRFWVSPVSLGSAAVDFDDIVSGD
ncbi:hypothetical protein BGX26_003856, partial [Mortierella sp. AD094]